MNFAFFPNLPGVYQEARHAALAHFMTSPLRIQEAGEATSLDGRLVSWFQLEGFWTARIAGYLLFALAAFVMLASILSLLGRVELRHGVVGTAVLTVAALAMPLLARQKRQLSAVTGGAALRADATESAVCGYLAWIALGGLAVNAIWGLSGQTLWLRWRCEGWEAMHGKPCCD